MRINSKITTHLSQKFPADFLLSILESGKFITEVQTAVAAFSLVRHELTRDILLPSQFPHAALEFPTPHDSMVGHFCPKVKRRSLAGGESRQRTYDHVRLTTDIIGILITT
jgi:hypothetical protein